VKPFDIPDLHHLRAAQGWLELGNHLEANAELENVSPESLAHPAVLELRWLIYSKESKWDACQDIARAITVKAPEYVSGWLHYAYATRRATGGSVQAAFEVLRPVADRFPEEPTVLYNLACYECQLGNLPEAWNWIEKAFDIGDPKHLKLMALDDKDLEPLWLDIAEI
jgi:tetratricopeptide (TPR) repeat protein